ncbi:hypothetical protein ACE1OC_40690 [Streptomyces sp. DSM 116496]|uniref:hypothetical protein n=1 Tax=Streptomyces stoeckheimensis TaxID=3344656 RepID=UPI0038B3F491
MYDGIRRDRKWNDQSDTSDLYQARLIRDLKLPAMPVVAQLAVDEEECSRAAHVLELLALAGSDEAREGLRADIRMGKYWVTV